MVVRGAPAIGIAAAYGVVLAAARSRAGSVEVLREDVERACAGLVADPADGRQPGLGGRPHARARRPSPTPTPQAMRDALLAQAESLHADEVDRCRRIGGHGAELLRAGAQVLTHCNAGALATAGIGTALGVIRAAHRRDPSLHVWVDETRPLLQGARLTAWELREEGIPATLITDSAAGWLMAQGKVDAVITGADRIARNGDVANKIGTYAPERPRPRPQPAVLCRRADLDHRPRHRDRRGHPHRAPPRRRARAVRAGGIRRLQPRVRHHPGREYQRDHHRARRPPAAVPVRLAPVGAPVG